MGIYLYSCISMNAGEVLQWIEYVLRLLLFENAAIWGATW